jgi:hypothetical protein
MIKSKFYPLTAEELIELCSVLTDAELKTLLYLKALHPFTDSYKELDTSQLAEHLNISRRSVQRFLKKFKDLNLIEYEITTFKYKTALGAATQSHGAAVYDNANLAILGSPKRQQDRQGDPRIAIHSRNPHQIRILQSLRLFRLFRPPRPSGGWKTNVLKVLKAMREVS